MSLWSDQSDALLVECIGTFGIPVQYQRGATDPFSVSAIFGHPNQEDAAVYGQGITLDVRVADFAGTAADPEPDKGDVVTFANGDSYTVYLVQIDSEGAGKLYLQAFNS
jgi:hypothetical protein